MTAADIAPPPLSVALAGNPNAGKSTLFNTLTGSRQHVGNWPGKTIEKKTGELHRGGRRIVVTDLPGAYSLSAYSMEEIITRDFLLGERPDAVVIVADVTNLERNLYLVVQLLETGLPSVVVLNMMDVAEQQGLTVRVERLRAVLAAPVVPAIARRGQGLEEIVAAACDVASGRGNTFRLDYGPEIEREIAILETALSDAPLTRDGCSPRWLAIRLLEGDADMATGLFAAPAGEVMRRQVASCRARLALSLPEDVDLSMADRRYTWIHEIAGEVITAPAGNGKTLSDRIDRFVTGRYLGIPIFLLAMWLVFKITTDLSAPWVDWLDGVMSGPVSRWVMSILGAVGLAGSWVASLLVEGVLAGVGSVLAFIPVLLLLYFALAVLEDSGYMARGAFVMDRLMNRIGLQGRSFLPLMVGFGCSVPAIYATRTLTNRRDRILTGLLVPFMSCGARLPVYVLFAAVFFPGAAGLVILGLYLLGIAVAIGVGLLLQRTILPATAAAGLVMELPPYRLPNARSIRYHVWLRTRAFLQHAASLILFTTLAIWLLSAIPARGQGIFAATPPADSVFGRLSAAVAPALRPLGFGSWQSGGALISGLVAKEVVVSTLAQTYGAEIPAAESDATTFAQDLLEIVTSFGRAVADTIRAIPGLFGLDLGTGAVEDDGALAGAIRTGFEASSGGHGAAAGLAFMVFVLLYTPCMAAIAAERHELGGRWAWASLVGQLLIAWMIAYVVFRAGVWIGGV